MIHLIITLLLLAAIAVLLYFILRKKNNNENYNKLGEGSGKYVCVNSKYNDLLAQLYNADAGTLATQLKADKINAADINTAVVYTKNPPVTRSKYGAAIQSNSLFFNVGGAKWKIVSGDNLAFYNDTDGYKDIIARIGNSSGNYSNRNNKNCC